MNAEELHRELVPLVERAVKWTVHHCLDNSMAADIEQEIWLYVYGAGRGTVEQNLSAGKTENVARYLRRVGQEYADGVKEIRALEIDLAPDETVWLAERANTGSSPYAVS